MTKGATKREAKPKFKKPTKAEIKELIEVKKQADVSGDLQNKILRQRSYRNVVLKYRILETEREQLQKQADKKDIIVKWQGMTMPMPLIRLEIINKYFGMLDTMSEINYLKQALKTDGLSDQDIVDVAAGQYKKDEVKFRKV